MKKILKYVHKILKLCTHYDFRIILILNTKNAPKNPTKLIKDCNKFTDQTFH